MDYKISRHFKIESGTIEFRIDLDNNHKFYVIYGRHVNGYYIAIPEERISCEAVEAENTKENAIRLTQAGILSEYSSAICEGIKEMWKYE